MKIVDRGRAVDRYRQRLAILTRKVRSMDAAEKAASDVRTTLEAKVRDLDNRLKAIEGAP